MTTFEERERGEEAKFRHELELGFKIRNRRNKMFGLWVAGTQLGLADEAATAYARDLVMADFELPPRGSGMLGKVRQDLQEAGKEVSDHQLDKQLHVAEQEARRQVMAE